MKYKIVGSRPVAGFAPGATLSLEELHGCNLQALVEGGHLQAVSVSPRAVKAASAEADEAESKED